jgi:alpha-tubulin suppressor-like RCC1 family protein
MALLVAVAASGCTGEPSTVAWHFEFADPTARARAVAIEVSVRRGGCDGEILYAGLVRNGATAPAPATHFAPGRYALVGYARDAACWRFATACEVIDLPRDGVVTLVLEPTAPARACPEAMCVDGECHGEMLPDGGTSPDACTPTGETCDGIDNDCDGTADEDFTLATDPEHCGACGQSCKGASCEEGACVGAPEDVLEVATGRAFTCARRRRGDVWCWGQNDEGQLGNGTRDVTTTPTAVMSTERAVELTAGSNHACLRTDEGRVHCWGRNVAGQLGDGSTNDRATPGEVFGLDDAALVVAGGHHTCAVRADRTVVCWGWNSTGQLGTGDQVDRAIPAAVPALAGIVTIAAATQITCGLDRDDTVWCWGDNAKGQLGNGTMEMRTSPTVVVDLPPATDIAAAYTHACALLHDGSVSCWGEGTFGQLGDGTAPATRSLAAPVLGLEDATRVRSGSAATCTIHGTGSVSCWGYGGLGQVGDGATDNRLVPSLVEDLTGAVDLARGSAPHFCAYRDDTVWCWGRNDRGQVGDGTTDNALRPTSVTDLP